MRLTRVQREVLRLMVKWERHYPGIEQDYDTYGWLVPGAERWVAWRTIVGLEAKGLLMPGPLLPQPSNLPYWALASPPHFITTAEGERIGRRLLERAVEEIVPTHPLPW